MLSGQVPQQILPVSYGANLVALTKKDGGIRPIAIGSNLRRLTSKICYLAVKEKVSAKLQPNQLVFGIKGECKAAVHAASIFLNSSVYGVFVKIYVRNAFNSVNRICFMKFKRGA
ncbi:jg8812 [Pararge aegeria aegeria]|uniref:Jg8812 protein n=1 Tax=Pararge aegeria aegeria TaxID=348720 RepID=A0A8S4S298_9NEOP|nr:jg8812 [Pararge aegeria aegeria]